jgi:hypothetical protein
MRLPPGHAILAILLREEFHVAQARRDETIFAIFRVGRDSPG